jgi:hypothetical protein
MIEIVVSLLIIVSLICFVSLILRPKKLYNTYLREIQKLGYKVYNIPFAPLGAPYYKILKKD